MSEFEIFQADLTCLEHQEAVLAMLNAYATDAMGDGKPLSEYASSHLIEGLVRHPTTLIFLAMRDTKPCGIAICFRGFSTLPPSRSSISMTSTSPLKCVARVLDERYSMP